MEKIFKMVGSSEEPQYSIVSPLGRSTAVSVSFAPPLNDLNGKKIGFVWSLFTHGDTLTDVFTDLLRERFNDISFTRLPSGKTGKWGDYPQADFTDVVKESGVNGVISLVGG